VPIYHGPNRGNLANNVVHGSVLLSDDGGITYRVASPLGFGNADKFSNENQAVELLNGTVLINARSLSNITTTKVSKVLLVCIHLLAFLS